MSHARLIGIRSGMEKQAVLGTMAAGAGLHMATNLGMKMLKGTKAGHKMESAMMAAGMRRGAQGKQLGHITRDIARYGVGPETLVPHEVGRRIGAESAKMSKGRRIKLLKKLRKNIASSPELREAPVTGPMVGAINRVLQGKKSLADKLPTVAEGAKRSKASRAASAALGAGAAIAEPHSALHMGLNVARAQTAKSKAGKRFLGKQLEKGLKGKKMNPALAAATDLAVSPGALDTRRLGLAARKELERRGAKPKEVDFGVDAVKELIERAKGRKPATSSSP